MQVDPASKDRVVRFYLAVKQKGHSLVIQKNFLFFLIALRISYAEVPLFNTNLQDYRPEGRSLPKEYISPSIPRAFTSLLGDDKSYKSLFLRRDLIDRGAYHVYFSLRADHEEDLLNKDFSTVSGKELGNLIEAPYLYQQDWSLDHGLNLLNGYSMGEIASTIYQKFPDAADKYHQMGFEEQYFFATIQKDTEGVVLKNRDQIVISIRGTEPDSIRDWITDSKFFTISLDGRNHEDSMPKVHRGFYKATTGIIPFVLEHVVSTLENRIRDVVNERALRGEDLSEFGIRTQKDSNGKIIKPLLDSDNRKIYITGHSLGAAIGTILYAELLLAHRTPYDEGFTFSDPLLRKIPAATIDRLIKTIFEERPELFSDTEQHALGIYNESLRYLPVIQADGFLIDNRLAALTTFGSPRVGNWMLKNIIENYAKQTGSQIIRYENLFVKETFGEKTYVGDIITRVPFAKSLTAEYSHMGIRVYFNKKQDEVKGDLGVLRCDYTDINKELELTIETMLDVFATLKNDFLNNTELSLDRHEMSLYKSRIRSYLPNDMNSNASIPESHKCRRLSYLHSFEK